jgi:ABC-type Zn uptake system ZnuABC Zn-binding protein ZnuA
MSPVSPAPRPAPRAAVVVVALFALVLAACGTDTEVPASTDEAGGQAVTSDLLVVATTSILGDIVEQLVGDDGTVEVIMPPGADPHGFQASASDAALLREADLVVANGLQLEESLISALAAAEEEGVRVLEVADQLDPIEFGAGAPADHGHDEDDGHGHEEDDGHGHEEDDGHGHEEDDGHGHEDDDGHGHEDDDEHGHEDDDGHGHEDDDGHAHGPEDPHVWFDPIRMVDAIGLIVAELAEVDDHLDAEEWERRGEDYADQLLTVHDEMVDELASIPDDRRKLVTNHDALGYLAHRYGFEVLGTVIPGSSTQAEADARQFSQLIETVEEAAVPAVFAENTDSTVLAEQLASEVVGRSDLEVEVVSLYTDALGEPGSGAETYLGLLRTTSQRIAEALR